MTLVETRVAGAVATVTLNDPKRRNALSAELLTALLDAVATLEEDPRVRVVVVTNAGSTFCAGADLTAATSARDASASPSARLSELFTRIRGSRKPYVGRIAGHCVAGGVGLAAVMDVALALDTATFGFSEVRIGVAPAVISVVCLAKMRRGDARELFLRGGRFSAAEAARVGLINRALAREELDREVREVVNDLLAGEPFALGEAKRLTDVVPEMSVDDALAWTAELSAALFARDEAREGMRAFLEKRPASWVRRVEE